MGTGSRTPTRQRVGRPSSRTRALDAALDLLRGGQAVSLESAAAAAGLTKPGLMYHFPTKEALMTALVDHVVDGHELTLRGFVPDDEPASPTERMRAYARWSIAGTHDPADLVMLADPRLHEVLVARWTERMGGWVELPDDLPTDQRARLQAVRLLADGVWMADAADLFAPTAKERAALWTVVDGLLEPAAPDQGVTS